MNERETKSMEGYGEAVFATEYLCKEYASPARMVRQTLPDSQKCGVGWGALWTALPCTRI